MSPTAPVALLAWNLDNVEPDTTVHPNVEIRDMGLDPRGAHLTHVRMLPGSQIVGTVHPDEHEYVWVLQGAVTANIGGQIVPGAPGTNFNIEAGLEHGYVPVDPEGVVELLAIYMPAK